MLHLHRVPVPGAPSCASARRHPTPWLRGPHAPTRHQRPTATMVAMVRRGAGSCPTRRCETPWNKRCGAGRCPSFRRALHCQTAGPSRPAPTCCVAQILGTRALPSLEASGARSPTSRRPPPDHGDRPDRSHTDALLAIERDLRDAQSRGASSAAAPASIPDATFGACRDDPTMTELAVDYVERFASSLIDPQGQLSTQSCRPPPEPRASPRGGLRDVQRSLSACPSCASRRMEGAHAGKPA